MGLNVDQPNTQEDWSAETLAQAAQVSSSYVRRLCRKGILKCRKFASAWLIPYEEGRCWLEEHVAQSESEDEALTTEA